MSAKELGGSTASIGHYTPRRTSVTQGLHVHVDMNPGDIIGGDDDDDENNSTTSAAIPLPPPGSAAEAARIALTRPGTAPAVLLAASPGSHRRFEYSTGRRRNQRRTQTSGQALARKLWGAPPSSSSRRRRQHQQSGAAFPLASPLRTPGGGTLSGGGIGFAPRPHTTQGTERPRTSQSSRSARQRVKGPAKGRTTPKYQKRHSKIRTRKDRPWRARDLLVPGPGGAKAKVRDSVSASTDGALARLAKAAQQQAAP